MNLRVFKKDIEYYADQFLADCDLFILLNPGKDAGEIAKIEEEAIDLYNDIRNRANHPEGAKRAFYAGLLKEMDDKLNELYEKLSAIVVENNKK